MPEDMEKALSQLMADAGKQVAEQHAQEQAQQQAQQAQQDPLMQLKQQELAVKQADVDRKAQKDAADIELAREKMGIEKVKATAQFQKDTAALDHQNQQADKRLELETLREMIKAKQSQGK